MLKRIEDPIIGQITILDDYVGEFDFLSSVFGGRLSVRIELIDSDGFTSVSMPSEKQRAIFDWFQNNQNDIFKSVENSVYEYYKGKIQIFHDAWGAEADSKAPHLSNSGEIWKLICNPSILIPSCFSDLTIMFSSSWDPEHGITVFFENGKVILIE